MWGFDVEVRPGAKLCGNFTSLFEGVVFNWVVEVWLGLDFDISWHIHMTL